MFEKFTAEAREAVVAAQEEARSTGAHAIDSRHVLLALVAGDRIRVVATLGQQQDATLLADPAALDAVVVSVQAGLDSVGQGQTILTVEVPEGDAAGLAAMAATGRVAVVLDSRDR